MMMAAKNDMSRIIHDPETIHHFPDASQPDAIFHHRIAVVSRGKTG
jgi:hypothetical protein